MRLSKKILVLVAVSAALDMILVIVGLALAYKFGQWQGWLK